MKACFSCAKRGASRYGLLAIALSRYQFATPDIRILMRQALGHAVSGRTIKRLVRATGCKMKRGRPPTTPRIHTGSMRDLVEVTASGIAHQGEATHLLQEVQVQYGLTPRQYLKWVESQLRHGRRMMRRCLLCSELFASMESTDRHCSVCRGDRRRLVNEDRRSFYAE